MKNNMLANVQASVKRWMLAFTLLISFFALSGYVNNNIPIAHSLNTETLIVKPAIVKNALSFQRATIAFYGTGITPFFCRDNFKQSIILHNRFGITRYHHLSQLYVSHKNKFGFHFISCMYPNEETHSRAC